MRTAFVTLVSGMRTVASTAHVTASCHLLGCPHRRATPRARRSSPISRWLGVLLLATLAVVLCPSGPAAAGPDVPAAIKRVIFVTIDTLSADLLGVHGYPRDTSPFLDELGRIQGEPLTTAI